MCAQHVGHALGGGGGGGQYLWVSAPDKAGNFYFLRLIATASACKHFLSFLLPKATHTVEIIWFYRKRTHVQCMFKLMCTAAQDATRTYGKGLRDR